MITKNKMFVAIRQFGAIIGQFFEVFAQTLCAIL